MTQASTMTQYEVIIKSAGRKGLGVFAHTGIPKGAIVTTYPAQPRPSPDSPHTYVWQLLDGSEITGEPWTGDVPSAPLPVGAVVGHLVNDIARIPTLPRFPGLETWSKQVLLYEQLSSIKCNVKAEENGIGLVFRAKRDIAAGEEITVQYGALYWNDYDLPLRAALRLLLRYLRSFLTSCMEAGLVPPANSMEVVQGAWFIEGGKAGAFLKVDPCHFAKTSKSLWDMLKAGDVYSEDFEQVWREYARLTSRPSAQLLLHEREPLVFCNGL